MENIHKTVLLQEAIEFLNVKPGGIYIDATFGFGGHTKEILRRTNNKVGHIIGIEVDKQIYDKAINSYKHTKNLSLYNRNFVDVDELVLLCGHNEVDGIVFDLGTNLYQIKDSGKGFSFLKNEKLDMRLDKSIDLTAREVVNSYTKEELEEVLKRVDESFYHQIAKRITDSRRSKKIETTFELSEIVESVKRRRGKIHPATLTFMAIRIEVNSELDNLQKALTKSIDVLKRGGRLVVISFHSGEDRLVKNFFREQQKLGKIKIVNKKVIKPSRKEELENPASRSAKMRVVEK